MSALGCVLDKFGSKLKIQVYTSEFWTELYLASLCDAMVKFPKVLKISTLIDSVYVSYFDRFAPFGGDF